MEQFLKVGVITTTHGVHGEVKVYPTTDDPRRFLDLKEVFLRTKKDQVTMEIQNVKFFKNMVILKFKGIDTLNDVEQYRQCELYVDREHAVPLGEDEYFIADLIDMQVDTDEGESLGILTDVLQTAANDVYVVTSERYGEVLIPAIEQCIIDTNVEEAKMIVHLLPGLIDEKEKKK